ncbi:hypothetical protein N0V90_003403 [Kalmusia sp. IMI 367209]|nr:hypothetical protein N0V90_003403 [Kalmusia sp. IMI 367209]
MATPALHPTSPRKAFLSTALRSPLKMLAPTSPFPIKNSQKPQPRQRRQTIVEALPIVHIQRASTSLDDPFTSDADAKWYCCACGTSNSVHVRASPHPLGALACNCPHKPCGSCSISGTVRPFLPIEEPAMVPTTTVTTALAETSKDKSIAFGIICLCCGLSWRAREIGNRYTKTLRKMPSLQINKGRLAPLEGRLRKSRSTLALGNKRVVTPPGVEMPKQAEYATVKFSGVQCTCGTSIDLGALCFQIVGEQVDENVRAFHRVWVRVGKQPGWSTTEELLAQGHGEAVVRIRGVVHPNPLRSYPVEGVVHEE